MTIYQHDERARFRFQLRGPLVAHAARELECSWQTALSILGGKDLVVDITGVTEVDDVGRKLLNRMRESGAHITDQETGGAGRRRGKLPAARRLLSLLFPAACNGSTRL